MVFITKDTVFEGAIIRSESPMEIEGYLKASIECSSDLTISGRVEGDIKAGSLTADGATILGNITCTTSASILSDSQIQGNISADKVIVSAAVRGDILAKDNVTLESDAVVLGNITALTFQVNKGALVRGAMTSSDVGEGDLFDRIPKAPELPRRAEASAAPEAPAEA